MLSLKLLLLTRSLPVMTTDGSRVLEKKVNKTQVSNTVFTHLKSIGSLLAGVHILSPGHRCFGSKPTHPRAQSHCVVSQTCATEFKRKRIIWTDNENVSFYWVPLTFKDCWSEKIKTYIVLNRLVKVSYDRSYVIFRFFKIPLVFKRLLDWNDKKHALFVSSDREGELCSKWFLTHLISEFISRLKLMIYSDDFLMRIVKIFLKIILNSQNDWMLYSHWCVVLMHFPRPRLAFRPHLRDRNQFSNVHVFLSR